MPRAWLSQQRAVAALEGPLGAVPAGRAPWGGLGRKWGVAQRRLVAASDADFAAEGMAFDDAARPAFQRAAA